MKISICKIQEPALKSVWPFAKIINLTLGNFSLSVLRVTFIFLGFFVTEKSYRSSYIISSAWRGLLLFLAEIYLYETVNNDSNTGNHWNLKSNNQMLWPMRTRKVQIVEHLNNEKCETTRVEQRRSHLISRRLI